MTLFTNFRTALAKRAEYNQTKYELSHMPTETAIDLGLFKEDAAETAARAIYG